MIRVMISIDEVKSLRDLCGEIFGECIRDEKGEKSDCPLFGPGVCVSYGTDEEGEIRSGGFRRTGSSGSCKRHPERRFDQRVYPGEMSGCKSGEGAEEDAFDPDQDRDDTGADRYILEEEFCDEEGNLLRYTLYSYKGRDTCADGAD